MAFWHSLTKPLRKHLYFDEENPAKPSILPGCWPILTNEYAWNVLQHQKTL